MVVTRHSTRLYKSVPNGDALIDSTTWDKMKELFFESDVVDSGMFYSNTKTIKKIIIMRKSKEVSNYII